MLEGSRFSYQTNYTSYMILKIINTIPQLKLYFYQKYLNLVYNLYETLQANSHTLFFTIKMTLSPKQTT